MNVLELTGLTLTDCRKIRGIYQLPRWTKEEAKDMLRNWLLYAVAIAEEGAGEDACRTVGDVTDPIWAAAYHWRPQ